jgi:hypothetical protein
MDVRTRARDEIAQVGIIGPRLAEASSFVEASEFVGRQLFRSAMQNISSWCFGAAIEAHRQRQRCIRRRVSLTRIRVPEPA